MKPTPFSSNAMDLRRMIALVAVVLGGGGITDCPAASTSGNPAMTPDAKTHTLFMGADMAIERDGKLHRVEDVTGSALVIRPNGKPVNVQQSPKVAIRVQESLKIAEQRVTFGKLLIERAYTPENDPFRQFVNSAGAAAGQAAAEDLANGQMMQAEQNMAAAMNITGVSAAAEQENARAQLQVAQQGYAGAQAASMSDQFNAGTHASRYAVEADQGNFDALRVLFEVKSDQALDRPYYVLIAQFSERGSKTNTARKWVYAKSLGALPAGGSRSVDLLQGGFPPGYVLDNYSVHIYNAGQELATDASRKRVELTESEAFQYQVIEYISAHKGQSRPATLATQKFSPELRQRLAAVESNETYFLRVSKEGKVLAAFRDAAGKRPLQDDQLEAVLQTIRFKPALQDGKPVEQIAPLKPSSLPAI